MKIPVIFFLALIILPGSLYAQYPYDIELPNLLGNAISSKETSYSAKNTNEGLTLTDHAIYNYQYNQELIFNSNNVLTSINLYDEESELVSNRDLEYDANGLLRKILFKENNFVFKVLNYSYNSDNKVSKIEIEPSSNSAHFLINYSQDRISSIEMIMPDGSIRQKMTYEYHGGIILKRYLDSNEEITKSETYTFYNDRLEEKSIKTSEQDVKIYYKYLNDDTGNWIRKLISIFEYEESDHVNESLFLIDREISYN